MLPTRWNKGLAGRRKLEAYFRELIPAKRASDHEDLFAALTKIETDDGFRFSDEDVVNHMIFLMMAAHDTSTITATAITYYLAKHPEWQEKARAEEATRAKGVTGENLLRFLEQRLDNIVFRAGWARTRPQARQFVNHGLIDVNGARVDIPSYRVKKGDVVSLRAKSQAMIVIQHNLDTLDVRLPAWLDQGDGGKSVTVRELPLRDQIDVPVREQLIVELYSK